MKKATTELGYSRDLGQFFSPKELVEKCISLKKYNGRTLEPSCGNGAFRSVKGPDSVFIEIDKNIVQDPDVLVQDFFDYPIDEKFDTIIGNPPYVDNSKFIVSHTTGIKVQANLYLYFIEKCFYHLKDHGELIFIVPREFIKLTSAKYVNDLLCNNGTITHYFDYGDQKLFTEACPNVCIFRYEKGNYTYKTETFTGMFTLVNNDGLISFVQEPHAKKLGDLFNVRVGAVSGADKLFEHKNGLSFVYSKTRKTGTLKKMIYQIPHQHLLQYKDLLMDRRIKKFNEQNWYEWGRAIDFREGKPRIYVNCKTRNVNPFFINKCDRWDGSILAIFPKKDINLENAVKVLNSMNWNSLGFMTGGRFIFSQKALMEAPIDEKLFF